MSNPIQLWRRQQKDRQYLGLTGTVITWTTINIAPPSFSQDTPYIVALVQFTSGVQIYGQMAGCTQDDMKIGMSVVATLRRIGTVREDEIIRYGIKFTIDP